MSEVMEWVRTGDELIGKRVFTNKKPGIVIAVSRNSLRVLVDDGKNQRNLARHTVSLEAVDPDYRKRYEIDKSRLTTTGRPSIGVPDEVNDILKGMDSHAILDFLTRNGFPDAEEKYEHLNPGMLRMAAGNVLRARVKKGIPLNVHIDEGPDEPEEEPNE